MKPSPFLLERGDLSMGMSAVKVADYNRVTVVFVRKRHAG
jgi:hypothetical protein